MSITLILVLGILLVATPSLLGILLFGLLTNDIKKAAMLALKLAVGLVCLVVGFALWAFLRA